ncbi:sigma-70 family RNA polymerase sigma factor [Muricauda sp. SCSIO 64092]|uniref:RNA polymerase sigma factor n=1 Tax=Allomuricauda sp. SCSIO 64092 TaxID=2908842 RepID=UPI001FF3060D|nr:sigma-70 family RNA polymerase sigma factor [Muricauda sp. SCSIO 64092]UOY05823.1 sigma-70 family RNA polymerase sigma factor [Muricauda sp. SCSIO 64092]
MERKNFGLTEASFGQMVLDLKANDTRFFQQVFLVQFKETLNYVKREYGASHEDAYDATMDALLEFRKRFVDGKLKYGNLRFLFTKMSTQMYLRNKKRQQLTYEDLETLREIADDHVEAGVPKSFRMAWRSLGANCKQLLTQHYYGAMQLTEIARELSKSPATVRKQKERCIKKIKDLMLETS